MSCQSCEGCNSCVSCQTCVLCEMCHTTCNGTGGCLDCESFCLNGYQIVSDRVGNFSWGVTTNNGDRFFDLDTWKKIITYINNARSAGSSSSSGLSSLSVNNTIYMTAKNFNDVSAALFNLGGNNSSYPERTVNSGDIIYGFYFDELKDQANKLKYKSNQCDRCNTSCNNCDECEGCNNCQSCNMCEGGNKSFLDCQPPKE